MRRRSDAGKTYEELAERYNHAPGSFHAMIDAFSIPGEPELSMIVRRVCRSRTIWPEQMFGYERARSFAAATPGSAPLATGRCDGPSRANYIVMGRRLCWRAAYERTDLSIENIAALFGYSPGSVRPWATSWKPFESVEGAVWWHFWGPTLADLIGVPLDEYDPAEEAERILEGAQ